MSTQTRASTFDEIEAIAAERYAEANGTADLKADAIRAVYTLTSLLRDLSDPDYCTVMELLRAELNVLSAAVD